MDRNAAGSGRELVLDNRKLIIAFALLICLCGGFFVIGFMEGRRQGVEDIANETVGDEATAAPLNADLGEGKAAVPDTGIEKNQDRSVQEQLDWYESVNKRGDSDSRLSETKTPNDLPKVVLGSKPADESVPKVKAQQPPGRIRSEGAAKISYSVQVGAFRARREAEIKAEALKAKGYDCVIELPQSGEQLFLIKVGRFGSRAEAVGMQLRLKKDGFTTFIKKNN